MLNIHPVREQRCQVQHADAQASRQQAKQSHKEACCKVSDVGLQFVAFLRRCYTCQVSSVAAHYRCHGSGTVPRFGDTVYHMKKFLKTMNPAAACVPALFRSSLVILFLCALAIGGYKARPWTIG